MSPISSANQKLDQDLSDIYSCLEASSPIQRRAQFIKVALMHEYATRDIQDK